LSKDWSETEVLVSPPTTVEEAVDRLLLELEPFNCMYIRDLKETSLSVLHYGLGMAIRNSFGLHHPDSVLLAACTTTGDADDASQVIITALWQRLQDFPDPF
jgi:hypothetical protein